MRLFFLRHGQSTTNARWDASGIQLVYESDPELTELGRSQVVAAASILSTLVKSPHQLYTSLMRRAAQSAMILSLKLNTPPRAEIELHEVGGLFSDDPNTGARTLHAGPGRSAFGQLYPGLALPASFGEAGWWHNPFEDGPARAARARRVWYWLVSGRPTQEGDDVVIVTHLGFFNEIMRVALGCAAGADAQTDFRLDNGAVTLLECDRRVRVAFHNRAC